MDDKTQMRNMLIDVINHFGANPEELRNINNNGKCKYSYLKNKPKAIGCAIGMYLPNDICIKMDKQLNADIASILDSNLRNYLPKWIQNMDASFLNRIQSLHDIYVYWSLKGLSEKGRERVNYLCSQYKIKPIKYKGIVAY